MNFAWLGSWPCPYSGVKHVVAALDILVTCSSKMVSYHTITGCFLDNVRYMSWGWHTRLAGAELSCVMRLTG